MSASGMDAPNQVRGEAGGWCSTAGSSGTGVPETSLGGIPFESCKSIPRKYLQYETGNLRHAARGDCRGAIMGHPWEMVEQKSGHFISLDYLKTSLSKADQQGRARRVLS